MVGITPRDVEVRVAKQPVKIVRAKLETATPDRTQYKPYAPTLSFSEVYVDIPVPAGYVTEEKGSKIILDVDGLAVLLDVVATSIEEMNQRWTMSKKDPYKKYNPLVEP
jgi:hypothetical protein